MKVIPKSTILVRSALKVAENQQAHYGVLIGALSAMSKESTASMSSLNS